MIIDKVSLALRSVLETFGRVCLNDPRCLVKVKGDRRPPEIISAKTDQERKPGSDVLGCLPWNSTLTWPHGGVE